MPTEFTYNQRAVLESTSKRIVVAGGRGTGKTRTGLEKAFLSLRDPHNIILYMMPTIQQCKDTFEQFIANFQHADLEFNLNQLRVAAPNDSFLIFDNKVPEGIVWSHNIVDNFCDFDVEQLEVSATNFNDIDLLYLDSIRPFAKLYAHFRRLFSRSDFESHSWSSTYCLTHRQLDEIRSRVGEEVFRQQYLNIWPSEPESQPVCYPN